MDKNATFYFSLLSPWVYFAGQRFHDIAQAAGATVSYRPVDLLRVFRETGGTPLAQLHPSRRIYRQLERQRWSRLLNMPINDAPKHHPVDESLAARLVIAAERRGIAVWPLAHGILTSVWVRDENIADPETLVRVAERLNLDGRALLAAAREPNLLSVFEAYTKEALGRGVFGVPSFIVDGELFFGQDRLDFVARALAVRDSGVVA